MRKLALLCAALLCLPAALAQTPVPIPVTGNLGNITGAPEPDSYVQVQLQNCTGGTPLVTGFQGIVQTSYRFVADTNGNVNGNIWPNDQITCSGTTGATQYAVTWVSDDTPIGQTQCYQIVHTQGSWNLNTQPAVTCTATPANPQDGYFNNIFATLNLSANTGTFAGAVSWSGGPSGAAASTTLANLGGVSLGATQAQAVKGALSVPSLNNAVKADQQPGTTADQKINACLIAAEALTGVCDATGLTGPQTLSANAFAGTNGSPWVLVLAPNGLTHWTVSATQVINTAYSAIIVEGSPNAYAGLQWTGQAAQPVFDIKDAPDFLARGLYVDCNSSAAAAFRQAGGVINIFDQTFVGTWAANCTTAGWDGYTGSSYSNVNLSKVGSVVTGTLTSGTFPGNWIGVTDPNITISSASHADYNTSSPISITIQSATTFTATAPQGAWTPAEASATATVASNSSIQDWLCYACYASGDANGVMIEAPMLKWFGGRLQGNTTGMALEGNGAVSVQGTVFTGNQYDLYAPVASNQFYGSGDWFENSTGAIVSLTGQNNIVSVSNSQLHTNSATQMFNLSGAGSGTVLNLFSNYVTPTAASQVANLSASAVLSCDGWCPSVSGTQPLSGHFQGSSWLNRLDTSGNLSVSGGYRINGVALASTNLSDSSSLLRTSNILSGTSGSLGGAALTVNQCSTAPVTVTGATTSMHVYGITPATDPNGSTAQNYDWYGTVTAANTVTLKLCAIVAGTPAATTYSFLVY